MKKIRMVLVEETSGEALQVTGNELAMIASSVGTVAIQPKDVKHLEGASPKVVGYILGNFDGDGELGLEEDGKYLFISKKTFNKNFKKIKRNKDV